MRELMSRILIELLTRQFCVGWVRWVLCNRGESLEDLIIEIDPLSLRTITLNTLWSFLFTRLTCASDGSIADIYTSAQWTDYSHTNRPQALISTNDYYCLSAK